jgi:hypothetical protein
VGETGTTCGTSNEIVFVDCPCTEAEKKRRPNITPMKGNCPSLILFLCRYSLFINGRSLK